MAPPFYQGNVTFQSLNNSEISYLEHHKRFRKIFRKNLNREETRDQAIFKHYSAHKKNLLKFKVVGVLHGRSLKLASRTAFWDDLHGKRDNFVEKYIKDEVIKEVGHTPRGIVKVSTLYDHIGRYKNRKESQKRSLTSENLDLFRSEVRKLLYTEDKLVPLSDEESIEYALRDKENKAAGFPYFCKKADVKYPLENMRLFRKGDLISVAQIGFRAQKFSNELRAMVMVPFHTICSEAKYFYPIQIKLLQSNANRMYAIGLTKMQLGCRMTDFQTNFEHALGIDISSLDSSARTELLTIIFEEFKEIFVDDGTLDIDFERIQDAFINTKFLMPNGVIYQKDGGVPSGSCFTNLVDTVLVNAVNNISLKKLGFKIINENASYFSPLEHRHIHKCEAASMCLGDDVITGSNVPICLETLSNLFLDYGLIISPQKSKKTFHFLGGEWKGYHKYEDPIEIARKLIFPERRRNYFEGVVTTRTKLEYKGNNPHFRELFNKGGYKFARYQAFLKAKLVIAQYLMVWENTCEILKTSHIGEFETRNLGLGTLYNADEADKFIRSGFKLNQIRGKSLSGNKDLNLRQSGREKDHMFLYWN